MPGLKNRQPRLSPGRRLRLMKVTSACFAGGCSKAGAYPRFGLPEVAFAGRSNSGKSSAINRLCSRRKLARVSATPGRTGQINFFLVNDRLVFADLPGYGYARVSKTVRAGWGGLMRDYLRSRQELIGVVLVTDARRDLRGEEERLLDCMARIGRPTMLLATKIDRLRAGRRGTRAPVLDAVGAIPFSAATGLGVAEAWGRILSWAGAAG